MSNIVEQVNSALTTEVSTALGNTYSALTFLHDVTLNNFRTNNKRYGVRPLGASQVSGITRVYTLDHEFEFILTHGYINKEGDDDQRTKSLLLFDKMDDIFKRTILQKAGVPSIILSAGDVSHDPPDFLVENNVVVQRSRIVVKYRQALSL